MKGQVLDTPAPTVIHILTPAMAEVTRATIDAYSFVCSRLFPEMLTEIFRRRISFISWSRSL
jgi:hypothetical protein